MGYYRNGAALRKIFAAIKPDILNAHYASGYGTLARRSGLGPLLLSVWGSDVYEFPDRSFIHRRIVAKNLKSADKIASTSHAMAERIAGLTWIPQNSIAVTPFGADLDLFPFFDRSARKRPKTVIGTVKGLKPIYGIDILLRAFRQTSGETKMPLELRIYGDGPEKAPLRQLAAGLGLGDSVKWMGGVPHGEVPGALADMDIFACFSRQESFGAAAVEAMATGLPVAATDCVGFREVVEDGASGLIGPVGDYAALAGLLARLASNPDLRHAMGRCGRVRAVELYDWKKNVALMESVYQETIQRRRASFSFYKKQRG
jgi:glycosyltransferase involved in cell wall biosynthesis